MINTIDANPFKRKALIARHSEVREGMDQCEKEDREKRKGERMGCDNDGEETVEGDENEMICGRGEERNREEKENFRGRDDLGEGKERGKGWTVWQRKRGRDEPWGWRREYRGGGLGRPHDVEITGIQNPDKPMVFEPTNEDWRVHQCIRLSLPYPLDLPEREIKTNLAPLHSLIELLEMKIVYIER